MKHLAWLTALLFVVGCSSDVAQKVNCTSADTLNLITMCASPDSADLAVYNAEAQKAERTGDESYNPVPLGDSPRLGPDDAVVTIVMFTDLQCPYCAKAHLVVKEVMEENDDLRVVFKHFPLPMHRAAIPMAIAALTAGSQGKFWEYVDLAFAGQQDIDPPKLKKFAEDLGLDTAKFTEEFGTEAQIALIQADVDLGRLLGVTGTPSMFVNGVRVEGFSSKEDLQDLINEQRELVERLREAGVDKNDMYWRTVALNYEAPLPVEAVEDMPEPEVEALVENVDIAGAPTRGAKADDALVTVVTFTDFECPFCGRAEETWTELRAKYPKVRFVFRHFPLPFHQNAMPAAVASLVALEAGKFWEYHDLLFAHQKELTADNLAAYAKQVGVNEALVKEALATDDFNMPVLADMAMGTEIGVRGTPAFFINGIRMSGAQPIEEFASVLDQQIELATKLQAESKLKGDDLYQALIEANRAILDAPVE